ncbi:MAG TPA: ABC transporter ATP-binding protein [bacterium]|nr:ABC transporter ATP-binding protein [bacterium]
MITFEDVGKTYHDGRRAVDGISMTVGAGECVVLVGPSGCGKTTTLKLTNRLIEPTSGRVLVNGRDTRTTDAISLRRGIGYVIQDVGLLPHMTVIENVGLVPRLLGWPRARVAERAHELLETVGLPARIYAHRRPFELSGGQRQRIGVARALAADPPVILMDEPFGALDPITRAQLQEEFLRLRRRLRKTILFVTHDIDEAVRLGDRVAVMRDGRIAQLAPPAELLRSPADEFVRRFVGADRAMKLLKLAAVRDLIDRRVGAAREDTTVEDARRMMSAAGADTLIVTGTDGAFSGIVHAGDLEGRGGTVGAIPPRARPAIAADQNLHDAMSRMLMEGVPWLPVVDGAQRFDGVITMTAFTRLMDAEPGGAAASR